MRRILLAGVGLCAPAPALAQPALPGSPATPSPLILDQSRTDRAPALAPARETARDHLAVAPSVDVADDAAAAPIRSVRFEGTKVPAIVAAAAEHFIGRPARRATLEALTRAMSEEYAKSNVELYTISVPQQDFAGGVIRIVVAEGHIEGVAITGDVAGRKLVLVKAYADGLVREHPLTRPTLERML